MQTHLEEGGQAGRTARAKASRQYHLPWSEKGEAPESWRAVRGAGGRTARGGGSRSRLEVAAGRWGSLAFPVTELGDTGGFRAEE